MAQWSEIDVSNVSPFLHVAVYYVRVGEVFECTQVCVLESLVHRSPIEQSVCPKVVGPFSVRCNGNVLEVCLLVGAKFGLHIVCCRLST